MTGKKRIHVLVHLKPDILDAQGQAIARALASSGHPGVGSVRAGKSFYIDVDSEEGIDRLCRETLANPLIEEWSWEVVSP